MQVWAPVSGSTCRRSTPRNRGAVGRRSAGYWNVKAGCGVYFSVSQQPLDEVDEKDRPKEILELRHAVYPRSPTSTGSVVPALMTRSLRSTVSSFRILSCSRISP